MYPANAHTIRLARQEDDVELRRLVAEGNGNRPLTGPVLLAESRGRAVAALSIVTGAAAHDPRSPSPTALTELRLRDESRRAARRRPALRDRLRAGLRPAHRPVAA